MKKITFLMILLVTSLGFSQELVVNGDWETGAESPWFGNQDGAGNDNLSVVDDGSGSNFVNVSTIATADAGAAWKVGLSQVIAMTENTSYELSYTASADANRDIIAGIGKNGGDFFANSVVQAITTTPTTYSHTLIANFDTVTDAARVLFDLAAVAGTVTLDDISLTESALGVEDYQLIDFSTYPNPTRDSWTVKTKNKVISSIQVFDVLGKNVLSMKPNLDSATIDGSNLKAGIYFAQVRTAEGASSIKLIKQ